MVVYKKSTGPKWHSFYYDGSSTSTYITGNTGLPISIYISVGADSDPTQFSYDLLLKDMMGDFVLDATELTQYMGDPSGYSMAIYVAGQNADESLISNILKLSFRT